jgi:hypothetical protein
MTNCRYWFVRLRGLTCSTYKPSRVYHNNVL